MKTQINKKIIICFISVVACFATAKTQTLNSQAQKYFRKPLSFNLPGRHQGKSFHGLHDPVCKTIPPCLTGQTTLGGSNYDQGNKMIQTRDGGFIVCGETVSNLTGKWVQHSSIVVECC